MTTIITSLPIHDNDGNDTFVARATFFALLRSSGVAFTITSKCVGFWYDDDGKLYQDKTLVVEMDGRQSAIKTALQVFGRDAKQLAVLMVVAHRDGSHIIDRVFNATPVDAARLAKKHGGATLMGTGAAVSYAYAALEVGADYAF